MSRPPTTEHGTYGYARRTGCECTDCKRAHSRYVKRLMLDHSRGISRRIDPTDARLHVLDLVRAGVTPTQVARAAGLAHTGITRLVEGKPKYLFQSTVDALLGVTLEQIHSGDTPPGLVLPVGALRRVHALGYMGWTQAHTSERMGYSHSALCSILKGRCKTYNVALLDKVYRELRDQQGPSSIATWRAYRRGDLPPMCWDDETIDDPLTQPAQARCVAAGCANGAHKMSLCLSHYNTVKAPGMPNGDQYRTRVLALAHRRQQHHDTAQEVLDLMGLGIVSVPQLAGRLGVSEEYIATLVKRNAA